jgi:hypothetical protein
MNRAVWRQGSQRTRRRRAATSWRPWGLAPRGLFERCPPCGCRFAKARGRRAWRARGRAPTKKMPRRAATLRDAAAWAVRFVAAPRKGNHPVVVAAPRGPSQGAGVALEILARPDPLGAPATAPKVQQREMLCGKDFFRRVLCAFGPLRGPRLLVLD